MLEGERGHITARRRYIGYNRYEQTGGRPNESLFGKTLAAITDCSEVEVVRSITMKGL
jgi:hypothetical protein